MDPSIPHKSAEQRANLRAKKHVRRDGDHSSFENMRKARFRADYWRSVEAEIYPRDNEEDFPTSGDGWSLT